MFMRSNAHAKPLELAQLVGGGQGRSFGHLGNKSPLHLGGSDDGRRHAQAPGEVEAEAVSAP
jgi:hypothetical protein